MDHYSIDSIYPSYLLDRRLIINDSLERRVNSFKLAAASDYFKCQIKELFALEITRNDEKTKIENSKLTKLKRKRVKSLSEIDREALSIYYDDIKGLNYLLTFAHINCNEFQTKNVSSLNDNLPSIIKTAIYFKSTTLMDFIYKHIQKNIQTTNSWIYWSVTKSIKADYPEMNYFVRCFLMENFIEAYKFDDFLNVSLNDLQYFLESNELNVKDEKDLLHVMNRWIEYDLNNREQLCPDILRCLRLGKIRFSEISDLCSNIHVKNTWNACVDLINCSSLNIEDIVSNNIPALTVSENINDLILYMQSPRFPREALYVIGGWEEDLDDSYGPSKAVQVYDPRAGKWNRYVSDKFALDTGYSYAACVSHKNAIYIIGGYIHYGSVQTLKVFDFMTKEWKPLSPMHEKRNYVTACYLDEHIYAIGGHDGSRRLKSVEKYNIKLGNWSYAPPMNTMRSDASSDTLDNKIFVCGGFDGVSFHASVEAYNPETVQWTFITPMNSVRSGLCLVTFCKRLYAIGGNDGQNRLRSIECFDPSSERWVTLPSLMTLPRSNFCAAVLESDIYAVGGWSDETNTTISIVEKISPLCPDGAWQRVKDLPVHASANCCCTVKGLDNILEHITGTNG